MDGSIGDESNIKVDVISGKVQTKIKESNKNEG